MSAFETYVNTELPNRPTLLTYELTSYQGNPNSGSIPAIMQNCPKGTLFLNNIDSSLWKKHSAATGSWVEMIDSGDLYTSAVQTYYVDPVSGSDANTGSASNQAFQTLTKALSVIPLIVNHDQTIQIAAGTLVDTIPIYVSPFDCVSGSVIVQGTMQDVFPTQGIATGTFDASFAGQTYVQTATCAGGGWAVDALRAGTWVELTSGPGLGMRFPISSNTATSLEVACQVNSSTGGGIDFQNQTFKFVRPATTISTSGTTPSMIFRGGSSYHLGTPSTPAIPATGVFEAQVSLRQISFKTAASSSAASIYTTGGAGIQLVDCGFLDANGNGGVAINAAPGNGALNILRCLFSCNNSNRQHCSFTGRVGFVYYSCFDRGSSGVSATVGSIVQIGAIFNGQTVGLLCLAASRVTGTWILVKGCINSGCQVYGNSVISFTGAVPGRVYFDANATAITAEITTLANQRGGRSSVQFNASVAGGVVLNGGTTLISLNNNSELLITGTVAGGVSLLNASGWAVNMAPTLSAVYNTAQASTGLTMSGNVSGDFTLDGTTITSLASLRALTPKRIVDLTNFNRLVEV